MSKLATIVTAGIISQQGKILLVRRAAHKSQAGCWEFPGGKLEVAETPQQCLMRELYEELSIRVEVGELFFRNHFSVNDNLFCLLSYRVNYLSGQFRFIDHDLMTWTTPLCLSKYPLSPADIEVANHIKSCYKIGVF